MAELQSFAESLWIVDGPLVRDMGFMFTTRMTIVKLSGGSLWIDSPVPADSETLRHIADLGPVQFLVAATPRHVWRLAAWHLLFPEAKLWAARHTPFTLQKGGLPFAGILADESPQAWADDIEQLAFKGNPLIEEVLFLHKKSGTVILDDLIQVHPQALGKPFLNALIKIGGVASPHGGVPFDIRLSFTNRETARRSLQKLLSWNFDKLIIAHGRCIERDAKSFVERAFRWLG